jgi:glycogen operon protein
MKCPKIFAALLACVGLIAIPATLAQASINSMSLGATYEAQQANITFRVYSSQARRIMVYLYASPYGTQDALRYVLSPVGGGVWSKTVPVSSLQASGISGAVYYGYRAWGPNWPYNASWTKGPSLGFVSDVDTSGNRFNPNKLLLDPYALETSQDPLNASNQNGNIFASGASNRNIDSGTYAPKGIVLTASGQGTDSNPTRAQKDDVIYELHVRGFTKQDTSIASSYRGTYKGAGLKASYLASLGVTAVEFLPVQETQNDANDVVPNSDANQNYWGYMTENYFSPDRHYAYDKSPGGPTAEFQAMVHGIPQRGSCARWLTARPATRARIACWHAGWCRTCARWNTTKTNAPKRQGKPPPRCNSTRTRSKSMPRWRRSPAARTICRNVWTNTGGC